MTTRTTTQSPGRRTLAAALIGSSFLVGAFILPLPHPHPTSTVTYAHPTRGNHR